MVLFELGNKLKSSLDKLKSASVVDEKIFEEIMAEIARALLQADVNVRYVSKMRENIRMQFKIQQDQPANLKKVIQQEIVRELTSLLDAQKKPFQPKKGKSNVVMFVGLQGAGKTTTCTKYAYYWQKKGYRVALVCADTFRAGAFDQLKQNATKVRIPFYGSHSETDPVAIAELGVQTFKKENYEMIIVDTSGRHKQEESLFAEMQQVRDAVKPDEIIFVMDGSIGQACFDQATAFRQAVNVGSVIITKLDGHAKGGGALSAVAATQSPIIFIGTGEHFDEFEQFDPQSFIKRLLGLGDLAKLMETVTGAIDMENQGELMQNISKGQFSLRDLQSQFQSILKLGSLSSFMSMLPGFGGSNIINKNNEQDSIKRIKRFLCMFDGMTQNELDGTKITDPSRIYRIAKGSGTSVEEVNIMLEEHKRLAKVIGTLGKPLGKGNDLSQLQKNPKQIQDLMGKALDPNMMQQMGGMGNIMNMMKEVSKMDGVGDMMKGLMSGGMKGLGNLGNLAGSLGNLGNLGGLGNLGNLAAGLGGKQATKRRK